MKVRPIGDRILVKQLKTEERTKSGIYLPKNEEKREGIIIEIGKLSSDLKIGDRILYSGISHEEIEINNERYIILETKEVIAIIEE